MTTTTTRRLWMQLMSYQVLDQYMEFRGETNRSLAAKAGVSSATIGHLRSGARNTCRPVTARKIAFALQVLPESLFLPRLSTASVAAEPTHRPPVVRTARSTRKAAA